MLDFIFIAETANGTIIKQTPDDRSTLDPLNRSAFYDVLNCGNPIVKFSLVGKGHIFSVDLRDGHIEIDGTKTYTKTPPEHDLLTLIYYRQIQQRLGLEIEILPDGTQQEIKKLLPITRYYIGWQTTYKGKNYKFEMGVD